MVVHEKTTWLHVVFMYQGAALSLIWRRLLFVTAVSVLITWLHERYGLFHDNLTLVPFSLIGIAVSIFLGFRNNTSYDRFWEGRKLWGRVVNISRTITRQILTLIGPADADPTMTEHRRAMVYRVVAYVHLLRQHLRGEDALEEVSEFLSPAELEALRSEHNRPVALLQWLGDVFRSDWDRGWVDTMHLPVLESSLTDFTSVQGGCERIKSTPIPVSYNILLHRIVGVYCLALPFGLVADVGVLTPVVVLLVAYAFFGLDAVGGEIEDPFGTDPNDLPLSSLTRMIEINLRQRLGETELPPYEAPVRHVLS